MTTSFSWPRQKFREHPPHFNTASIKKSLSNYVTGLGANQDVTWGGGGEGCWVYCTISRTKFLTYILNFVSYFKGNFVRTHDFISWKMQKRYWFLIDWLGSASCWFHYADILWWPQFGVVYDTEVLWLIVPLTPKGIPSFISRGAAHRTVGSASTSEGRNYVKEILLPV
jgi:hypothetical protein